VAATFVNACPETVSCEVFISETERGRLAPMFPDWREIESTIVVPHLDLIYTGEMSAEAALTQMGARFAASWLPASHADLRRPRPQLLVGRPYLR
jgi:hypothetical protein